MENLPDATLIIHDINQEIPGLVASGEADVMITEIMEAGYYVGQDSRLAAPLGTISGKTVNVEAGRMGEQSAKGQRKINEVGDHIRNIRVKIDDPFVNISQERRGKHGFADGACLEQHIRTDGKVLSEASGAQAEGLDGIAVCNRDAYAVPFPAPDPQYAAYVSTVKSILTRTETWSRCAPRTWAKWAICSPAWWCS